MTRASLLSLALLTLANAAWAACGLPEVSGGASAMRSRWDEVDAQGKRLLRETGTLTGQDLALTLGCGDWQTQARWLRLDGRRDYEGLSSRGMPVRTRSDIDEDALQVQALWQASPAWSLGLRGEWRELRRELASTGAVLGYSERHRHASLALGGQGEHGAGFADWRWQAGLWLGAGRSGSADIDFPNADPVRLRTGSQRYAEAKLALLSPARSQGWQGELSVVLRRERIAAGPSSTLWRDDVPVGAASQPQQRLQDAALRLGLAYRF